MPEGHPQEGEVWSGQLHVMYHVIDVNEHWVCGIPVTGFEDSLFPLDNFLSSFRYIGTPTQPYRHPITLDSYWRLRPGVARNFGADNEIFTVYDYRDGVVHVVDNDDYDRFRHELPEEEFRRLFRVDGALPGGGSDPDDPDLDDYSGNTVHSGPYRGDDDGGPYRTDPDEVEPDMEVLRVILANIPPGMALERVYDALSTAYQIAIDDLRENGRLIEFSQNGTLLAPWDRIKPPEEPAEAPSLWDRLEKDDAGS
jgi:hypothetical protein